MAGMCQFLDLLVCDITTYHNIGPVMRKMVMEPQGQIAMESEKLETLEEAVHSISLKKS